MKNCFIYLISLILVPFLTGISSAQLIWEMTPYKVTIYYSFDCPTGILNSQAAQKGLLTDVQNSIDSRIGGFWQTELIPAPSDLETQMLSQFDSINPDKIYKPGMGKQDKVLLMVIRSTETGWKIQVRDFDIKLRYLNGTVEKFCGNANNLADSVFETLRAGFAPIGKIDNVEKDTAVLRMRGGLLDTPSEKLFSVKKDTLFAPMIRFNENDGSLKKVNPIDWTYFWTIDTPESAKGQASSKSQLFCRIESGMRNALSARRRGRVEALAILVHPTQNSTTLKLVAQKDAGKPLRGYALYRVDPITNENKKVGNTDLNGNFIVEPDSVSPLHILVIKNGNALLAKLPILPGSQSELTAPVMDDDLRLQAEGYLQGIEEEIVDQIVLREIAMARIEAKIAKSDKQAAHDLLNDIRKMKTRDDFLRDLESRKSRFFTKEPAQQARINQMFDKTMKLLGEYMSSKRIAELETKINSMP